MGSKVKLIDFKSGTFDYILTDLTKSMNTLLRNMEEMGSDSGKLSLNITVDLEDKELDDGAEHTVPAFKHKIKSGFTVQDEQDGEMEGDYVLEKNENNGYQLSLLTQQLDMLEEEID